MSFSSYAKDPLVVNKRNTWSREETLELLHILRTKCVPYLNGTVCNRNGQMYRQIQYDMQRRGRFTKRNPQQIECKWKSLKFNYEKYKNELELGDDDGSDVKPCEYAKELGELFERVGTEPTTTPTATKRTLVVKTVAPDETIVEDDGTYYDETYMVDETQELSVDEDTVVIEEILYDSQDVLEYAEAEAVASTPRGRPPKAKVAGQQQTNKRRKLTAENMNVLLQRITDLQKEHNQEFNRKQMELIENEFETFRDKEKEHLLQLKLDMELLRQKFLDNLQKLSPSGSGGPGDDTTGGDAPDRTRPVRESKRRRVASKRKQ